MADDITTSDPWLDLPPGPHGTPSPALAVRYAFAPVAPIQAPSGDRIQTAVRYDDVRAIFTCPHSSRDLTAPGLPRLVAGQSVDEVPGVLPNLDGADHRRQRRILSSAFTPAEAERWRPVCRAAAEKLLLALSGPEADLVADFALPLPSQIICQMLGVPTADFDRVHAWSSAFLSASITSAETRAEAFAALMTYAAGLVVAHRESPGNDLVDALIEIHDEGDRLTEQELVSVLFMLVVAGHETTATMIARGVLRLLAHPDQYRMLVAHPDQVPAAVEEILRFDGPGAPALLRRLTAELNLPSGAVLAAGTVVLPHAAAANHDPQVYSDPGRFDIGRYAEGSTARPHLAFGVGPHFCLGSSLARMELQEALYALITRAPDLRLAIALDEVPWSSQGLMHKPQRLPVMFTEFHGR